MLIRMDALNGHRRRGSQFSVWSIGGWNAVRLAGCFFFRQNCGSEHL